ncbi:MAG: Fic family protein, partial [Solirubrobacterales bacterium]|nr:Fic family protein [Solirubrobacterales bacterium]
LHARFETIHPFLDGNGRLGRLLLVFFLIARGRLDAPLLYLSSYLDDNRRRYYAALQAINEAGDPDPWFNLFLEAVRSQSTDTVERARTIIEVRERYRDEATTMPTSNGLAVVELLFANPLVTTRLVEDRLGVSRPTAVRLLRQLEERGILSATAGGARGQRRYVAEELVAVVTGSGA